MMAIYDLIAALNCINEKRTTQMHIQTATICTNDRNMYAYYTY